MNQPYRAPTWIKISTNSAGLILDAVGSTITNVEICKDEHYEKGMARLALEVRNQEPEPTERVAEVEAKLPFVTSVSPPHTKGFNTVSFTIAGNDSAAELLQDVVGRQIAGVEAGKLEGSIDVITVHLEEPDPEPTESPDAVLESIKDRRKRELPRVVSRKLPFYSCSGFDGKNLAVLGRPDDIIDMRQELLGNVIVSVDEGRYKEIECTIIKLEEPVPPPVSPVLTNAGLVELNQKLMEGNKDLMRQLQKLKSQTEQLKCSEPGSYLAWAIDFSSSVESAVDVMGQMYGKKLISAEVGTQRNVLVLNFCDIPEQPEQLMTIEEQRAFVAIVENRSVLTGCQVLDEFEHLSRRIEARIKKQDDQE